MMLKMAQITMLSLAAATFAVYADEKPVDPLQVEAEIDEGLKKFGYMTGLALACVATEQKDALEREAMDINSEISRTLGGDRAFLFAASFGYGSNIVLKVDECTEVLKRYEERVASFRKGKGA
ncbi:hypothetical protein K0H79_18690 [Shewanella sp. FJAT-52076]|nr:hypothetical protein K0H79_18690 [Shewanella sp. FJAT-52076]